MLFFLQALALGITLRAKRISGFIKIKGYPMSTETTCVASYGFVSRDCFWCLKMYEPRMKMFLRLSVCKKHLPRGFAGV